MVFGWRVRQALKFRQNRYKNNSRLAKFNYCSFLPISFFRQFAKAYNIFFLVIVLADIYLMRKEVGSIISYLAAFIVTLIAQILNDFSLELAQRRKDTLIDN